MMKTYIALLFLFLPIASFGASSVRMLGAQPAIVAAASASGVKVTPVKSSESVGASEVRVGSLRAKTNNVVSANSVNSNSRFPVITPAHSYSGVVTPQTSGSSGVTPKGVEAIVDTVAQRFESEYYNKNEVYDNDEFRDAVRDVDDPRKDAIKIGSRPVHNEQLSSDYGYMWIEEN